MSNPDLIKAVRMEVSPQACLLGAKRMMWSSRIWVDFNARKAAPSRRRLRGDLVPDLRMRGSEPKGYQDRVEMTKEFLPESYIFTYR